MDRRTYLRAAGAAGAAGLSGLSGCLGFELQSGGSGSSGLVIPAVPEDRPDAVYVPSHVEGTAMVGTGENGDYRAGLMYSYAHRFWNVNGNGVDRTDIAEDDDVHLMASVWDPETGQVLPDTGLSLEITQDGSLASQEVIYPMLSQPMGFHYGANFGLDGEGEYTVTLEVGGVSTRKTGEFSDRFASGAEIEIPFEYSEAAKNEIEFEVLDDAGERGAVEPVDMETMPDSLAPEQGDLPGRVVGEASSNDAVLAASVMERPPEGVDGDGQYLAVSARTPYNRMLIPAMTLEATLARGGSEVFSGELVRTLDPDLSYHYGAVVDGVERGDTISLSPTVWPQTARHEGYETAFGGLMGGMPEVSIDVTEEL